MSFSRSKTSTQSDTYITDNRVAADNGAVVLGDGSTLIQDTTSDDMVKSLAEGAVEIGRTSTQAAGAIVEAARDINSDSLGSVENVVSAALSAVQEAQRTSSDLSRDVSTLAIEKLELNKRDADSALVQNLAGYAVAGVGILAAIYLLAK